MNVYRLKNSNEPERAWVKLQRADGQSTLMRHVEEPDYFAANPRIAVTRHSDSPRKGSKAKWGDITRLDAFDYPVFSERARAVFEPHLQGLGQWIPLDFEEKAYSMFWLQAVEDVLDVERSRISYFPDGKVMSIDRSAFHTEALQGKFMWLVKTHPSDVFVTDSAMALVREHGLTGFAFQLRWTSQHGPLPEGLKAWEKPWFTGLEETVFDTDAFWAVDHPPRKNFFA
jgi:hypothetical protein